MNILLINKHSKLEWEEITLGLSREALIKKYSNEKANLNAIIKSHEHQLNIREAFNKVFSESDTVMLENFGKLEQSQIEKYDLIISIGGDNSFTKVTSNIKDTLLFGVNCDPKRSVGALTRYSTKNEYDVEKLARLLDEKKFEIEEWTRLGATINGKMIKPATSEYFLGERLRKYMSRHVLVYRGKEYEQKCSGLIVATGAGSNGWFSSIKIDGDDSNWYFNPTEKAAAFKVSERYYGNKISKTEEDFRMDRERRTYKGIFSE